METKKLIKVLGIVASVIGAGASIATEFVNEKKMDDKIAEKVAEALANKE